MKVAVLVATETAVGDVASKYRSWHCVAWRGVA